MIQYKNSIEDTDIEFNLAKFLYTIKKNLIFIGVVSAIFALLFGYVGSKSELAYKTEAILLVNSTEEMVANSSAALAKSNFMIKSIAENLNLKESEVKSMIKVTSDSSNQLITIALTSSDNLLNVRVGNEFIDIFEEKIKNEIPVSNFSVLAKPEADVEPVVSSSNLSASLGLVLGAFLSLAVILLLDILDTRFRSRKECERKLVLPCLGEIKDLAKGQDEVKTILHNLDISALTSKVNTLYLTSTNKDEGKTLVAINLAKAYASQGKKVLVLETNKNAKLSHYLDLNQDKGLVEALLDFKDNKDLNFAFIQECQSINVISKSKGYDNDQGIYDSNLFAEYIKILKENFDQILIIGDEVSELSNIVTFNKYIDGALYLVSFADTRRSDALACVNYLKEHDVKLVGSILTKEVRYSVIAHLSSAFKSLFKNVK